MGEEWVKVDKRANETQRLSIKNKKKRQKKRNGTWKVFNMTENNRRIDYGKKKRG